jgi:hypothetical protein
VSQSEFKSISTAPQPCDDGALEQASSWWARLGQATWGVTRSSGRALAAAYHAIDPDVRRDLAQMPVLALTLLAPGWKEPVALRDDGRRPVIFVHGLGGHRGNFIALQGWLWTRGWRRCYSVGFPAGGNLVELSEQLAAFVRSVIEVNGLDDDAQVDLVGHSMGGVVSRLALEDADLARRVSCLVTLGTPHHGTHAARFAGAGKTLDLRPDSQLMKRLQQQEPWSTTTRLVCLWSESDPLMQPATTACVEGADNQQVDGMSHINYLLRPAAWKVVQQALGAADS